MIQEQQTRTLRLFDVAIDRIINVLIVYIIVLLVAGLLTVLYPFNLFFED